MRIIRAAGFLAALYFVLLAFVFCNCLMLETIKMNSLTPPANTFQWRAGCACTGEVMAYYRSLIGV